MKKKLLLLALYSGTTPIQAKELISVRRGNDIGIEEQRFVRERQKITHKNLQDNLETTFEEDEAPTVAVVASGGGNRAMIATLGFTLGLEKTNLLNSVTYMSALSGSTWFLAPWIIKNLPLEQFSHQLEHNVFQHSQLNEVSFKEMHKYIADQQKRGYKFTLCDAWGRFIGRITFGEEEPEEARDGAVIRFGYGANYHLSTLQNNLNPQKHPFPLFSAIFSRSKPYEWMEFSPCETGSDYVNAFIPTKGVGKHYMKGSVVQDRPELPLPYLLGLFGSAYAFDFGLAYGLLLNDVSERLSDKTKKIFLSMYSNLIVKPADFIRTQSNKLISQFKTTPQVQEVKASDNEKKQLKEAFRMSPPVIPNFTRGMPPEIFKQDQYYTLVDAGLDFNLPFPPLLKRNPDVYLVCDASSNTALTDLKYNAMVGAARYAEWKQHPFPDVNLSSISLENSIQLLYDKDDDKKPIIVYIPSIPEFETTKFTYELDQFDYLQDTMIEQVHKAKPIIIKALNIALERKKTAKKTLKLENQ